MKIIYPTANVLMFKVKPITTRQLRTSYGTVNLEIIF